MKVYFDSDYSDTDFIIVNAALHCESIYCLFVETFALTRLLDLASDTDTRGAGVEENDEQSTLRSMCQKNVEIALSKLTLYIQPSYDMTLALVLGVCSAFPLKPLSDIEPQGYLCDPRLQPVPGWGIGKRGIPVLLFSWIP